MSAHQSCVSGSLWCLSAYGLLHQSAESKIKTARAQGKRSHAPVAMQINVPNPRKLPGVLHPKLDASLNAYFSRKWLDKVTGFARLIITGLLALQAEDAFDT